MINAPQIVLDALKENNVSYANLVTINLGDAYGSGEDVMLYYTDYGHVISYNGNSYTPDNNLTEMSGISRKASTGSDSVDIVFSVTDESIIGAINSERYVNKPTVIERVIIDGGVIVGDFAIPIRTAWGLSHSISGDTDNRSITLTIDTSLGDLDGDNGWYALNSSHEKREPIDKVMRHSGTVMTEEQQKKYTTSFSGVISRENKPPALPKVYGYANTKLVPICMLKHRKTHTFHRHYYTTFIYVISIGDCQSVDLKNLTKGDERLGATIISGSNYNGGWAVRMRTPSQNNTPIKTDPDLGFWRMKMDTNEMNRLNGMYGKGLTLLFVSNRNRDDWLQSVPDLSVPVQGAKVYDPRSGLTAFSRNPMLQYADFLRSTEYGAGNRGIPLTDDNIAEIADHFDQLPESIGNEGINSILIDVTIDTAQPLIDNMNVWMEGVRLYTSDYYGKFNVRVESQKTTDWVITESDVLATPDFDSGEFTDKLNQLTYSVKQLVQDNSTGAVLGDLVEVDVEAVYPKDGSELYAKWLAEDGGIPNFDSSGLDYVTSTEQAYYWAMVDARISRQPREMTLVVGASYWLSEVGDVLSFSSPIMGESDQLWRISEVSENDNEVELELVAYDSNFYSPDPDAIPAPTDYASPPSTTPLSAVSGMAITDENNAFWLTWTPLPSANIAWYAVEVLKDGVPFINRPKVGQPPVKLDDITVGEYTAIVTATGIEDEGQDSLLSFSVSEPETPILIATSGNFEIEVMPTLIGSYFGVTFEFYSSDIDDFDSASYKGKSTSLTVIGLSPSTDYYFWVRTVGVAGNSPYAKVTVKTTNDSTGLNDVITDLDRNNFTEEVSDLITQTERLNLDTGKTLSESYQFTSEQIQYEIFERQSLGMEVTNLSADYSEWISGYEERLLNDERLIDASAYFDPDTGLIVFRGYEYTDQKFSQAQILIDGVSAEVLIQAERITQTNQSVVSANALIQVNAGNIELRATYTEVTEEIAGALEALVPAVSYQFNTGKDGWTGVTWNAAAYIYFDQSSIAEITGLSIDSESNTTISTRTRSSAAVDSTFSWNGLQQRIPMGVGVLVGESIS